MSGLTSTLRLLFVFSYLSWIAQRLLGGLRYMYITGHRDFERRRVMPGAGTRPAIEVDQGDKAGRRAANDAQIHG